MDLFEGPFDLLLNLISKHKLDIYDIPISDITTDYLNYIEHMRDLDLELGAWGQADELGTSWEIELGEARVFQRLADAGEQDGQKP